VVSGGPDSVNEEWFAFGLAEYEEGTEESVPAVKPIGTYTFDQSIDLGAVYTSRVTARIVGGGETTTNVMSSWGSLAELAALESADPDNWEVTMQYRSTDDDPAGSPTWSEWTNLIIGDIQARGMQFRAILEGLAVPGSDPPYAVTTPAISGLAIEIDMPDRIDSVKDLVVPAIGMRVAFTPTFKNLKSVTFGHQDLAPGDYAVVSNKDETGFDIQFFNSSDVAIERTTDVNAVGYGIED
jgi:hypothetical protein